MNTFFEVGVRYDKTMEDGGVRKVTENYLLDAISFTEAEKRATEEMEAYISGGFRVVTVIGKKSTLRRFNKFHNYDTV